MSKTRNLKLIIEYDGTHFCGWQAQKNSARTIQAELEKACKKIFGKKMGITGSGRTDSGAHALGQVANLKVRKPLTCGKILKAFNANLPEDIAVISVEEAHPTFHARYSAQSKIYRYTILNREARSAQQRNFYAFYPYSLNVSLMRKEVKCLLGRHDFKSFQATPPADEKKKSTIRTIKQIVIQKKGDLIHFDFEADGFLHKMIRNIVGTLLDINSGRLPKGGMKTILEKKSRLSAGRTAKAKGLCLLKVNY